MTVNAVTSPQADQSVYGTQKAEQTETKGAGGRDVKNDHDADDAVNLGPSLNLSGQTVGTIISQKA